ncbi:hypothetical protein [Aeromicrobium sp. UC242_57]|uniref:hypothetical protein n=1 Tax=Aeromicrobium sp. UC242_57 TaxID=3374624 RepID=UPI0037A768EC
MLRTTTERSDPPCNWRRASVESQISSAAPITSSSTRAITEKLRELRVLVSDRGEGIVVVDDQRAPHPVDLGQQASDVSGIREGDALHDASCRAAIQAKIASVQDLDPDTTAEGRAGQRRKHPDEGRAGRSVGLRHDQ